MKLESRAVRARL